MRIIVASDGSRASMVAVGLVRTLAWPPETTIRVVVVEETADDLSIATWLGATLAEPSGRSWTHTKAIHQLLDRLVRHLEREGVTVERAVPRGRPAAAILQQALDLDADLIVVGSRGHGTIATMLLGSVSAEIVDGASCPVLVARTDMVTSMVVGVDGSAAAAAALDLIRDPDMFPNVPVTLVSAADVHLPVLMGFESSYGALAEMQAEEIEEALRHHAEICAVARARLAGSSRRVDYQVDPGDPATALLRIGQAVNADIIAVGTTGRTGFRRLLVGSVARNVLLHAPCSVLVVPDPARRRMHSLDAGSSDVPGVAETAVSR